MMKLTWQHTQDQVGFNELVVSIALELHGTSIRHALRLPCIRCGGPKGMEPAAGAFMDTRDSRPLQGGIKDLSSLHPVTVPNC